VQSQGKADVGETPLLPRHRAPPAMHPSELKTQSFAGKGHAALCPLECQHPGVKPSLRYPSVWAKGWGSPV